MLITFKISTTITFITFINYRLQSRLLLNQSKRHNRLPKSHLIRQNPSSSPLRQLLFNGHLTCITILPKLISLFSLHVIIQRMILIFTHNILPLDHPNDRRLLVWLKIHGDSWDCYILNSVIVLVKSCDQIVDQILFVLCCRFGLVRLFFYLTKDAWFKCYAFSLFQ